MSSLKQIKVTENYLRFREVIEPMLNHSLRTKILYDSRIRAERKNALLNLKVSDFLLRAWEAKSVSKRLEEINVLRD